MLSERMKERLKNLAALRDGKGTNPNEANAAAQAIARLLAKEGLSEDDFCFESGEQDDEIDPEYTFIEIQTRIQDWLSIMCCDLALMCGCYPVRVRFIAGMLPPPGWDLTPLHRYSAVAVWGRERDIQVLQAIYPAFRSTMEDLANGQKRGDRRSYLLGAWDAMHKRMRESQNDVMEEIRRSTKTALAPVDWSEKARDVANESIKIRKGRTVRSRRDRAYMNGVMRGREQKIPGEHQAITGQLALGSKPE